MRVIFFNHGGTEGTEKSFGILNFDSAKPNQNSRFLRVLRASVVILLFITGCAPLAPVPTATLTPAAGMGVSPTSTGVWPYAPTSLATPTIPLLGQQDTPTAPPTLPAATLESILATLAVTPAPSETLTPVGAQGGHTPLPETSTPTESPRLPPERWQEWPVVPAATIRSQQIYQQGLALGNDPHAFSKIGDCQSVTAAFFGIYEQPGAYQLPQAYQQLQQTIDWFRGSFGRDSQAVRGGFNVASVLSSLWADPKVCQAGETPLDCEFRLHKPSLVLISMETGFEGRTAAVYEKYMRRIIEYTVAHGASPILATKADNFEGDQSINLTTAKLAAEYDLPLWNFWRAVQPLADHGMDMERNDKFHISVEAWNVRSFTGLEALDSVWKGVQ
jgi:hypothetical protein